METKYESAKKLLNEYWELEVKRFGDGDRNFGDFGKWLDSKIK